MIMSAPRYVRSGEAAKHLGVSRSTLHRWVDEGLITPAFRTPKRGDMRWDLEDLDRQLREARQRGEQRPAD